MIPETRSRRFTLFVLAGSLAWGLGGCFKIGKAVIDPNVDYYTCTMHPSVRSQDPHGKCPICSMDLVPVMKKRAMAMGRSPETAAESKSHEFSVPVERQQQIGVTYAIAERKPLCDTIRAIGIVAPNRSRQWSFVARVAGYVQKLYVTSPGESVEEGAPLMTIYSPELLTAERELVNLLEARGRAGGRVNGDHLVESSRRRWSSGTSLPPKSRSSRNREDLRSS